LAAGTGAQNLYNRDLDLALASSMWRITNILTPQSEKISRLGHIPS